MNRPNHVVVQIEGGDPEPVDVMQRGFPGVTIGRRFTVFPERLTGIVLYLGLERRNSDDARHPQYRSTTKHITWEVRHDTGVCSLVEYRRSGRPLGISRARALERFRPRVGGLHLLGVLLPQRLQHQSTPS